MLARRVCSMAGFWFFVVPTLLRVPNNSPKVDGFHCPVLPKPVEYFSPPSNFRQASTWQTWNFQDFPSRRPASVELAKQKKCMVSGSVERWTYCLVLGSFKGCFWQQDLYKNGGIYCVQWWNIPRPLIGYSIIPKGWKMNEQKYQAGPFNPEN